MSLTHELQGDILHTVETIYSFHSTKISHWYSNLRTWECSSHGREGDTVDRPMDAASIAWTKKHYFPKLGLKPDDYPEPASE